MENSKITDILSNWGVSEDVIENFKKNDINETQFKILISNESYLKELCPHIGNRINLKTKIQEYLDSICDTETTSSTISKENLILIEDHHMNEAENLQSHDIVLEDISFDVDTIFNTFRAPLPDFDLRTILQASPHGNSVLNHYNKNKKLNAQKRNIIVDILAKYLYTFIINNDIKSDEYNLIAARIVSLFPTESICTYYMKAVPTSKSATGRYIPAKGKLVDKVRNLLYISGAKRRNSKITDSAKINDFSDPEKLKVNEEINNDILWLKHNNEPWDRVIAKWINTYAIRSSQKFNTVYEYLEEWSILKCSKGDILINLDFENLYKEKVQNFYKYWGPFFSTLLEQRKDNICNEYAMSLIVMLDEIKESDKRIPVQIVLLGYLVPPKGRISRKIKISTQECIEGLLVQIYDAGDIDTTIKKQKEKAAARGSTVQPYVLIQGPLHNFSQIYIIIDDVKYHMQSAAKAFDLLFKLYHVFHAKYPQVAEYLYLIIQRKVYQINTVYDSIPPYIVDVLNLEV